MNKLVYLTVACVMGMTVSAEEEIALKLPPELASAEEDGCRLAVCFGMDEQDMMKLRFDEAKKKADEGNALACAVVSRAYAYGEHWYFRADTPQGAREDAPQDLKEAFRYAKLSAEKGNECGKEIYGQMYFYGLGTPTNYVEAVKVFSVLTNNLGHATRTASYFLGRCYWEGRGVKADLEKAEDLLENATDSGPFAGLASEWLWSHGKFAGYDMRRMMTRTFTPDAAAHYKPEVCTEGVADAKVKDSAVRFLPDAKAVLMVRPEDCGFAAAIGEMVGNMDDDSDEDGPTARISWAALSVLDVEVAYDYGVFGENYGSCSCCENWARVCV